MHRCLELAALGRGFVGNGALVGAVLVRDKKIVADGYYSMYGSSHAERQLLEKFDHKIRSTDTLYVNLEPCCPGPDKKNPPCTDILIERGIRHVVIGMTDPDPRVAGKGMELLRAQGVTVEGPFLRAQCEYLNRGYVSLRRRQRPWIIMKSARALDGTICNADGTTKKITSPEQDAWSHTFLRARVDAILVGVHTIEVDNPILNTRLVQKKSDNSNSALKSEDKKMNTNIDQYSPKRIILDPHLRVPLTAKVVTDARNSSTMILTSGAAAHSESAKMNDLQSRGVDVRVLSVIDGRFDWNALWKELITPSGDYHGIASLLVEGGQRTWDAFKTAGFVDEEVTLMG